MANRNKDFNEFVALQFEDIDFSRAYIMNLVNNEGLSLEESLRETVVSMGLKVFANKAGLSIQYVSDFVSKRKKLSIKTIEKYMSKVFQLRIKVSVEPIHKDVA